MYLLILAASAKGTEPVILRVWGTSLSAETKGQEAVIREFERRNPGIKVQLLGMGAGKMNPQKLMTAIVGNVPPDVIRQDRFTVPDWASRSAFVPLDSFIARDSKVDPLCPSQDQYYQATWDEGSYDGKIYAIPTEVDNRALYWNKELFQAKSKELRAAGLDPDRAPRTWEETIAYSKVLTEFNKDGTLKVAGFMPWYGNSWLYYYAFANNAYFLSPDGRTCTLNTPEVADCVKFIQTTEDIIGGYEKAKRFESTFLDQSNDPLLIGKVAMKVDGNWVLNNYARSGSQLEFGVAPPPVPQARLDRTGRFKNEADPHSTWSGGWCLAIPSGARHPEEAWRFIKFLTSYEGRILEMQVQLKWQKLNGREYISRLSPQIRANESILHEFAPADRRFKDALATHIELMKSARMRPSTPIGQILWDEQARAAELAMQKKGEPRELLATAQTRVQMAINDVFSSEKYPVVDLTLPTLIGMLGAIIGMILWIGRGKTPFRGKLAHKEARWAYLFVSPWLLGFLVLTLAPMITSLIISFTQYNVLMPPRFVGVENYHTLVTTDRARMLAAFGNAAYLSGIGVPLGLVTGLSIAMLLNTATRGIAFYRTLFYMPSIVPLVATGVLWFFLLSGDPDRGLISWAWTRSIQVWFGVDPPTWFASESWAKPSLILMGLWGAGGGLILWLAGLKGIPNQLYEAARMDGASAWRQFWAVTVPQLSPIIFFNAITGLIGSIQEFDRVYVLTDGANTGPADSLLVPVGYLFTNGFQFFKMGYASAIAWIIFVVILILSLLQVRLAKHWVHYEAEE